MTEPRFRIGDKVYWKTRVTEPIGTVRDGPFMPGVIRYGSIERPSSDFSYMVQYDPPWGYRWQGESVLAPYTSQKEWVPCAGDQRATLTCFCERQVPAPAPPPCDYRDCSAPATAQDTYSACDAHQAAWVEVVHTWVRLPGKEEP